MKYWEPEQNEAIESFLKDAANPTKEDLFNFFEYYFLHPDYETEFTHKVTKNIIEVSFDYFSKLPEVKKFHFLRALGKLLDVALTIKIWEFQLSRDDASWYWEGLPTYFLSLAALVEPLEDMRREMGKINKNNLHEKIVCVEGDAEFNFIRTIYLSTRLISFDFSVYNYSGVGNANNLVHFIKEKNRQGVKVFFAHDKDGRGKSFVNKVKKKSRVEKFFAFSRDFESAFPPGILARALKAYTATYAENNISYTPTDIKKLLGDDAPLIKAFEEKYQISISKAKLGKLLGTYISELLRQSWNDIINSKVVSKKYDYEIFEFVRFLVKS